MTTTAPNPGIAKKNMKHVIRTIMDAGSTTIGGCGDINRNVMMPPVPIVPGCPPAYARAGAVAAVCAELFVPQTEAFSEIWCDGEKLASVQYVRRAETCGRATAPPRPRRGYSVGTGRCGRAVDSPRRRIAAPPRPQRG